MTKPLITANILLVDDDPGTLMAMETILEGPERTIVKAESGQDALRHLLQQEFAVILLDVRMPRLDGFETAASIRQRARSRYTPIIFLSAVDTMDADVLRGYSSGAVDYLLKPFVPEILRSKVAVFVDLFRMRERIKLQAEELAAINQQLKQEITERKQAEEALRESEVRLKAILDNSPAVIFLKDTQGRYLRINPPFAKLTRLAPEQILGKTDEEIFPAAQAAAFRANDVKVLQAGMPLEFEEVAQQEDGPHSGIVYKYPLQDAEGKIYAIGGIVTDITERKRLENRQVAQLAISQVLAESATLSDAGPRLLQAVCDSVGWELGAIWRVDHQANVLRNEAIWHIPSVNPEGFLEVSRKTTFARGVGLPGRVWASGEPTWIPDILKDPNFPRAPFVERLGLHGGSGFPIKVGGEIRGVFEFFSREIREPDNALLQMMADIGIKIGQFMERKRAEAQLEQRSAELEAVNQELDAFAFSVAHDLRAPLRAMEGFSQALLEDYGDRLDHVGQDYAQRIVSSAQHLDRLIEDLLAYSHLSHAELKLQPVDLTRLLKDVQGQLKTILQERQAQLTIRAPLPRVLGHDTTLGQVLQNLLSNAAKFVASGVQPHVRVWAEERDKLVRLWVEDNGIGIAPQHQERIFRIFERLHGIETYNGTGIGLAIVRKAVERMGGRVGVESALGQGSRFWMELPSAGCA